MQSSKNSDFVLTAKGIGIILVVLGHAIIPFMRDTSRLALLVFSGIYSFHMPLFVTLSGYLYHIHSERYRRNGLKRFLLSKLQALMIPYIAFSVVSYAAIFLALKMPIIGSILFRSGYRVGSLADVAVSVLTYKNHIDQHLWYLYVLFLLLAFCYLTGRIFRGSIGIVLALVVYYIPEFIQTPDLLAKFCHSLIFFVIGRLAATISGRKRKPLWLAAFSVLWLGAFASRELILRDESFVFLERSLWLIAGVAGVSAVVLLASLIARTAAEAPLNFIGGYSMDIYILHQPFITSAISTVLVNMTHISYPVICAVATVSGLSLPVLLGKYLIRENGLLRLLLLGGRAKAGKPK